MRWQARATIAPRAAVAIPMSISQSNPDDAGAAPPVSGVSGVASGSTVGIATDAPAVPTATVAGSALRLPQMSVNDAPMRTRAESTVNEPSEFVTTNARSEMFDRAACGRGKQTSAGEFNL